MNPWTVPVPIRVADAVLRRVGGRSGGALFEPDADAIVERVYRRTGLDDVGGHPVGEALSLLCDALAARRGVRPVAR